MAVNNYRTKAALLNTNFMHKSLSEADSYLAPQGILASLLWNLKAHYHVDVPNSLPLITTLSHINPVHNLSSFFLHT